MSDNNKQMSRNPEQFIPDTHTASADPNKMVHSTPARPGVSKPAPKK